MKPNFALKLSLDGISLLKRASPGWDLVGEVSPSSDDLDGELAALLAMAEQLSPGATGCKVIIPNDQIRYLSVPAGPAEPRARKRVVDSALIGATPYDLDELAFDCSVTGDQMQIAAVALDTLEEASAFAGEHGFTVLSYVAMPDSGTYNGEPFFGLAPNLGPEITVEPDILPIRVLGRVRFPAKEILDTPFETLSDLASVAAPQDMPPAGSPVQSELPLGPNELGPNEDPDPVAGDAAAALIADDLADDDAGGKTAASDVPAVSSATTGAGAAIAPEDVAQVSPDTPKDPATSENPPQDNTPAVTFSSVRRGGARAKDPDPDADTSDDNTASDANIQAETSAATARKKGPARPDGANKKPRGNAPGGLHLSPVAPDAPAASDVPIRAPGQGVSTPGVVPRPGQTAPLAAPITSPMAAGPAQSLPQGAPALAAMAATGEAPKIELGRPTELETPQIDASALPEAEAKPSRSRALPNLRALFKIDGNDTPADASGGTHSDPETPGDIAGEPSGDISEKTGVSLDVAPIDTSDATGKASLLGRLRDMLSGLRPTPKEPAHKPIVQDGATDQSTAGPTTDETAGNQPVSPLESVRQTTGNTIEFPGTFEYRAGNAKAVAATDDAEHPGFLARLFHRRSPKDDHDTAGPAPEDMADTTRAETIDSADVPAEAPAEGLTDAALTQATELAEATEKRSAFAAVRSLFSKTSDADAPSQGESVGRDTLGEDAATALTARTSDFDAGTLSPKTLDAPAAKRGFLRRNRTQSLTDEAGTNGLPPSERATSGIIAPDNILPLSGDDTSQLADGPKAGKLAKAKDAGTKPPKRPASKADKADKSNLDPIKAARVKGFVADDLPDLPDPDMPDALPDGDGGPGTQRRTRRGTRRGIGLGSGLTSGLATKGNANRFEEAERMTVFGARRGQRESRNPRFLGLVLTTILLLFMAGVAAWAMVFLDDGLSALLRRGAAPQVASTPETTPGNITVAVTSALPQPVDIPSNNSEQGKTSDTARTTLPAPDATQIAALRPAAPVAVQPGQTGQPGAQPETVAQPGPDGLSTNGAGTDNGVSGDTTPPPAAPLGPEAQARYAATGIWQTPPAAPNAVDTTTLPPEVIPVALTPPGRAAPMARPNAILPDAPPTIGAPNAPSTPETGTGGVLAPIQVIAGPPPIVPPARPGLASPLPPQVSTNPIAAIRPQARPGSERAVAALPQPPAPQPESPDAARAETPAPDASVNTPAIANTTPGSAAILGNPDATNAGVGSQAGLATPQGTETLGTETLGTTTDLNAASPDSDVAKAAGASLAFAGVRPQVRPGTPDSRSITGDSETAVDTTVDGTAEADTPTDESGTDTTGDGAVDGERSSAAAGLASAANIDNLAAALTEERPEPSFVALRPQRRPENIAQLAAAARATPVPPPAVEPTVPSRASVTRQATVRNAIDLSQINLIGVYGQTDSRRALIRMENGRYRKVKVGDRIDGGQILAIGEDSLRYQKDGRNQTLNMPAD